MVGKGGSNVGRGRGTAAGFGCWGWEALSFAVPSPQAVRSATSGTPIAAATLDRHEGCWIGDCSRMFRMENKYSNLGKQNQKTPRDISILAITISIEETLC